jgi:hypothetical protein
MAQIIITNTFRAFHTGIIVTLSLREDDAGFFVRCQSRGYAVGPKSDTRCASRAEAETVYTRKYSIGMVGGY